MRHQVVACLVACLVAPQRRAKYAGTFTRYSGFPVCWSIRQVGSTGFICTDAVGSISLLLYYSAARRIPDCPRSGSPRPSNTDARQGLRMFHSCMYMILAPSGSRCVFNGTGRRPQNGGPQRMPNVVWLCLLHVMSLLSSVQLPTPCARENRDLWSASYAPVVDEASFGRRGIKQ